VNGEKNAETLQSINYSSFIALLVKELKELKKENKLTNEKIEELKNIINSL
jgi:hypothetical protein